MSRLLVAIGSWLGGSGGALIGLLNANPAFSPQLIVNSRSGQVMGSLFSTHPSTEARIQNLLRLEQEFKTVA